MRPGAADTDALREIKSEGTILSMVVVCIILHPGSANASLSGLSAVSKCVLALAFFSRPTWMLLPYCHMHQQICEGKLVNLGMNCDNAATMMAKPCRVEPRSGDMTISSLSPPVSTSLKAVVIL